MSSQDDTFHFPFISNFVQGKVRDHPSFLRSKAISMKEKAICLDDDPLSLRLVEHLLKKRYEVVSCPNLESAVKAVRHDNIDLFLCDYHLGESFTGAQAFETLRRHHGFNPLHSILITSYPSTDIESASKAVGFHRVFAKPLRKEFQSHCLNLRFTRFRNPMAAG